MNVDEVGALSHSAACSRMNGEDITIPEMCSITGSEIIGNNCGKVSLKMISSHLTIKPYSKVADYITFKAYVSIY